MSKTLFFNDSFYTSFFVVRGKAIRGNGAMRIIWDILKYRKEKQIKPKICPKPLFLKLLKNI